VRVPVTDPNHGSEYGGVGGLIQPSPHEVADCASEQLLLIYRTDPDDLCGESGNNLPLTRRID
jgi:hypothetical protein